MSSYQDRLDVAGAICRLPGGYQTRTSETSGLIQVKGGKLKGWTAYSIAEARRAFSIPEESPRAPQVSSEERAYLHHPAPALSKPRRTWRDRLTNKEA